MKKKISIIIVLVFNLCAFAFGTFSVSGNSTIPTLGLDNGFGHVFEENNNKYVLWGMDADSWGCQAGNVTMFHEHCDAMQYINANTIAIPMSWKMIEPAMGTYSFWYMDIYINMARDHGLKATVLWLGSNYASGDSSFVPDYILANPNTYTRITGTPFIVGNNLLCPSDPDTLNREKEAYFQFVQHLRDNNPDNTVMAINCGGESDYMRALPENQWNQTPEQNIRCTCSTCNSLYNSSLTNVQFMEQQFSKYIKSEIDYGATTYDIPTYSQVCAYNFFPGWRYAENAAVIKSTVNRWNHFTAPSVAQTDSTSGYVSEMNNFTGFQPFVFTDGIDTAWASNQARIEIAPWFNTMWYGSVGALYWDSPDKTVRTDTGLRDKLRKYWGPLKAMQYQIARYKTSANRFWWYPDANTHTWGSTGNFAVDRVSSASDYGACFELGSQDICFSGTTYGGSYTFTVSRSGGYDGYRFEKGYFDAKTGIWVKSADVSPSLNGSNAVLTVSSDSGDYTSAVIRYYKPTVLDSLTYEAEASNMFHLAGRLDSGSAWVAETSLDSPNYMIYGPYATNIPNGKREAKFVMKIDNNTMNNFNVVKLEIVDGVSNTLLATRDVTRYEFTGVGQYQNFYLSYYNPITSNIQYRVWYYDTSKIWVDKVVSVPASISYEKSATMNTTYYQTSGPTLAIDGNDGTYAQSNTNVPWDLTIDLQNNIYFNKLVFTPDKWNYASKYAIEKSTDGTNWTVIATETAGNGLPRTFTFTSTYSRYVRINVTEVVGGGTNWGHAIRDVAITYE